MGGEGVKKPPGFIGAHPIVPARVAEQKGQFPITRYAGSLNRDLPDYLPVAA